MSPASPIPDAALALLEHAVNYCLSLDPEGAAPLTSMQGYIIAFEFKGFGSRLYCIPGPEGLQLFSAYNAEPDCLLRGTPLGLARLGMTHRKEDALFSGQVEIEGDTALAQRFGDFMAGLEIDWEEQLSRLTGDPIAHAVGTRLSAASRWGHRTLDILGQDLKDYLQEEGRLLPTHYEMDQFLAAVDQLRDDGERLAARVERLRRSQASGAGATAGTPVTPAEGEPPC